MSTKFEETRRMAIRMPELKKGIEVKANIRRTAGAR